MNWSQWGYSLLFCGLVYCIRRRILPIVPSSKLFLRLFSPVLGSLSCYCWPFLLSMFLKFHKQIVLSKRASCCCVPSWSASYHNIYLKSKILQEMQIAFSFLYKCQQCNCLLLIFLLWSDSQPESVRLSLNIWVCWTMTPANLIQLSDFSCVATAK